MEGWKSYYHSGVRDGKPYEDKGTILELVKERTLKYNYWSNFSDIKDEPTNYVNIICSLSEQNGKTVFALTQDNLKTKEAHDQSEKNWGMIFTRIKEMLEED